MGWPKWGRMPGWVSFPKWVRPTPDPVQHDKNGVGAGVDQDGDAGSDNPVEDNRNENL